MYFKVNSAILHGMNANLIEVEADVSDGMPSIDLVGYLSSEVREAKERVRTAMKNLGFILPPRRITINLSPANIKKHGTSFDLPIAISVLGCLEIISKEKTEDMLIMGELGLDGSLKPVAGVLPTVLAAKMAGIKKVLLPDKNIREAAVVSGISVIGVGDLLEACRYINGEINISPLSLCAKDLLEVAKKETHPDFGEIKGQTPIKRAFEIAAAGLHNVIMIGPPGSGKTMSAKCLPSILPPLTVDEALQISKVYSVAGLLDCSGIKLDRPFVSPHHTASATALSGGGIIPRPGDVSLADQGVLFLDELPEFKKETLEVLRQPLEDKKIVISRTNATYTYPADFLLVAAANPCRCGYYPNRNRCNCSEIDVKKYMGKISGPLLDRIDLCIRVEEVKYEELVARDIKEEPSEAIRERVIDARQRQERRFRYENIMTNSHMNASMVSKYCILGTKEAELLRSAFEKMNLSARVYHKIIKVSRTIADLDKSEDIKMCHLYEALGYRLAE